MKSEWKYNKRYWRKPKQKQENENEIKYKVKITQFTSVEMKENKQNHETQLTANAIISENLPEIRENLNLCIERFNHEATRKDDLEW